MDGTTRPLMALLLVSLSGTACSFTKTPDATSVQLPEQPAGQPTADKQQENLDIQFALARTFEQERDLDRAASLYRAILMSDSRHVGALHRLAIVCDQQGRHQESRKLFQRALGLRPTSADLYCDLGYSFYCQQQWLHAERNFRLALDAAPDHERAHRHLGLTLAAQGKDEVALRELRKSGCSSAQSLVHLAQMQTFAGRLEEANRSCELARKADARKNVLGSQLDAIETQLAEASARAEASQDVIVARNAEPEPTPIQAVGFKDRSSAEPTPARRQNSESTQDAAVEEPAAVATRPLQRLLKWRRTE